MNTSEASPNVYGCGWFKRNCQIGKCMTPTGQVSSPNETSRASNRSHLIELLAKGTLWGSPTTQAMAKAAAKALHKMTARRDWWRQYLYNLSNTKKWNWCLPGPLTSIDQCSWYWKALCMVLKEKDKFQSSCKVFDLQCWSSCKICWSNCGRKRVTNQCLIWSKAYSVRWNPWTLLEWLRTRELETR